MILAPKGINDSLAILKNCFPNGIPMIVMHHRQPNAILPRAIAHPKHTIQIRFTKKENVPVPYSISFPKGQNASDANLKHCTPTGIPMIVMHQTQPTMIHARPPNSPPNKNQRILPKRLINCLSSSHSHAVAI